MVAVGHNSNSHDIEHNTMIKKIFIFFIALSIISCRKNTVIAPPIDLARVNSDVCKLITYNVLDDEDNPSDRLVYNQTISLISSYGDAAIEPLMTFIDTTKNFKAKYAACLTIHYIGINQTKISREREEFKNEKARSALLRLLANDDMQYTAMSLLVRNPWQTDVPTLIKVMKSSNDSWPVSNGLERYWLPNPPIKNKTRELLNTFYISIKRPKKPYNDEEFYKVIFRKFEKKYKGLIQIEDTLFNYRFYNPYLIYITSTYDNDAGYSNDATELDKSVINIYLDDLLGSTKVGFLEIGNNFNYYEINDTIFICSSLTAKKRWIDWWSKNEKEFLKALEEKQKMIKK